MNIFVGSASRNTENKIYNELAEGIGKYIVDGRHNYIFGGCEYGLMGKIYSVVSQSPTSKIIISMSDVFMDQIENIKYDSIEMFKTLTARKEYLISASDVIVIIPGGIGTIDEMITAIETKRNGEHDKPILIVNVNNYFNSFFAMLEKTFQERFADYESRSLYHIASSLEEATAYLDSLII